MNINNHEYYMRKAFIQAEIAYQNDEVPVGCVIVFQDKLLQRGTIYAKN